MKKSVKGVLVALAMIACAVLALKASVLIVQSGSWSQTGNLSSARVGASAALLPDARILVTGGDPGTGPLATADFFGTDGTISAAPPMVNARSQHVSVALQDGRVLVAGGLTAGGSATNAAEIYDPVANSWTSVGAGMIEARSGATAALLQDGRVAIAGGQNGTVISSTIEIFDPAVGTFTSAGMMSSPRSHHAMAELQDGRVLIVGGNSGNNRTPPAPTPVASTDIFDPVAGTVSAGPSLATARYNHSATTLLNGQVVVIGGNNGNTNPAQMDVTPAELIDFTAATPAFTTLATNLATPREGHLAYLLPNNNNVLIVGGTSAGTTIASAEFFTAQGAPPSVWTYSFGPTGTMAAARSSAAGSANQASATSTVMRRNGVLMVAGGADANGKALISTEAYGYATVQTDATEYAPGSPVTITGSGWVPGETVTLSFLESPYFDTHPSLTAVADANGNIVNAQFSPDQHDIGISFFLTAPGSVSQAQNTFADASNASGGDGTMTVSPTTLTAGSTSNTLTFTFASPNGGNFNSGSQATIQVPAGWTTPTSSNVSVSVGPLPNCTTATLGTITGTGPWTIPINMTCPAKDQFTVTYNVGTAPVAGTYTFTTQTKQGSPADTLTPIMSGSPVVTVNNPAPSITTLSPPSAIAGAAAQTLTINGTNFVSTSTVTYNAVGHTATFVSSAQLTIQLTAPDQATAGTYPVVVTNPTPGGGASNSVNFTVNNLTPTITTLSPSSATAGAAAQTLTINGTNFVSTSAVTYNAVGHTATFVSSTQLTIPLTTADQATGGTFPVVVTNPTPGGGTSNTVNFTVNNLTPTITTLSPSSATAGAAAQTLTINGTNFVSTSTVTYNAVGHTATFVSSTQLTIPLTAADQATAGTLPVVVTNPTPGGGTSNSVNFTVNNPTPTITTLSPSSVTAGAAAQALTINGTNFLSTSTVTYNAVGHAATFVNSTKLTIQLTAGDQATAGTFPVVVTNPTPGGGTSNTVNFTVNNPTPTITTLSPSSATAGAAAQTLTINGTNFLSTSTVTYNAVGHAATFVSSTQLTIPLTAADQATAGTFPVVVTNPTPGGGASNSVNFTVNNLTPTITTLSPSSATAGAAAQTLTINGTNFVSTSTVTYNAVGHTATFVSSTQLTIQLTAADQATAGNFPVVVTNPTPGGGTSNSVNFTINNPVPTTTSISPTTKTAGDNAFTLTVNGTNFVPTSAVNFNGSARTTTFVSSTQVTASINAPDVANAGAFPITVTNSAPGGGTSNAQTLTVNPQLAFTSTAFAILTGTCSSTISVQIQNANGSAATLATATVLNLSSNSGTGKFFSNSTCTTQIPAATITIAAGSSTANFFYDDTTIGSPVITVASTGLNSVTQTEAITSLRFGTVAFSVQVNTCSSAISLQSANAPGMAPTSLTLATTINLSSSSANGKFFSDAACTMQITSTVIGNSDANHDSPNFFYEDTSAGAPTLTGSAGNASTQQTESVVTPPSISKAFGAAMIPVNGTTSLSFTITNPAANTVALNGLAFTDNLPIGLALANPNALNNTCGGTPTAVAGSGSVSLSGGTVAVNTNCKVIVNVTGMTSGVKNNTTSTVTSTNGGTGNTASASITVASPPTISKAFGAASIPLNASTSLTFNITNSNTISLSGLAFSDALPSGLIVATPNNGLSNTCGGTSVVLPGSGTISLTSGTVAASSSCSISVNVTGTTTGVKNNITGVVSATESGPGTTSNTASLTVNTRATTTTIAPLTATAAIGQGTNFTVTVTDTDSGPASTPGGSVMVSSSNATDSIGACVLAQGANPLGTSTCTATVTPAAPTGTHTINASYPGDNIHTSSSTATTAPAVLTVINAATTTTVTSSANSSVFGQPVTFTATVTPQQSGLGTPAGTVQFVIDGTNFGGAVSLSATGSATSGTISTLSFGPHTVTATYTPAANSVYQTSTGSLTQTVNQDGTATLIMSSPNPSAFGQTVTITVTVAASAPGSGTPTGSVAFMIDNMPATVLTLVGGSATTSTSSLTVGNHTFTANYSGDANFTASMASAMQMVSQATTSTALMLNPGTINFGESTTVTATVTPLYGGTPTGTVTVSDGIGNAAGDSCTITLSSGTTCMLDA